MRLFHGHSSSPTYCRLSGDEHYKPVFPSSKRVAARTFRPSRRRSIFICVVIYAVFLFLYIFLRSPTGPQLRSLKKFRWHDTSDIKHSTSKIEPIFGTDSSPLQSYFPPTGDVFRPHVAPYNRAPDERPRTPLFIPFSCNNDVLQQAILSYISAGWPREDIIIIDNGGSVDSNNQEYLPPKDPSFLDYPLYRSRYGVSILQTPTLFTLSQLRNFVVRIAIAKEWPYFFWSRMDVVVLSDESAVPYMSFYEKVLAVLHQSLAPRLNSQTKWPVDHNDMRHANGNWSTKFFQSESLALVNVEPWRKAGHLEMFAYSRPLLRNPAKDNVYAGHIFDAVTRISNPETKFFPPEQSSLSAFATEAQLRQYQKEASDPLENKDLKGNKTIIVNDPAQRPNCRRFQNLLRELKGMQGYKHATEHNSRQGLRRDRCGETWNSGERGWASEDLALYPDSQQEIEEGRGKDEEWDLQESEGKRAKKTAEKTNAESSKVPPQTKDDETPRSKSREWTGDGRWSIY